MSTEPLKTDLVALELIVLRDEERCQELRRLLGRLASERMSPQGRQYLREAYGMLGDDTSLMPLESPRTKCGSSLDSISFEDNGLDNGQSITSEEEEWT